MRKVKQRETRKKKEKETEYQNVKVKHSASNFFVLGAVGHAGGRAGPQEALAGATAALLFTGGQPAAGQRAGLLPQVG